VLSLRRFHPITITVKLLPHINMGLNYFLGHYWKATIGHKSHPYLWTAVGRKFMEKTQPPSLIFPHNQHIYPKIQKLGPLIIRMLVGYKLDKRISVRI